MKIQLSEIPVLVSSLAIFGMVCCPSLSFSQATSQKLEPESIENALSFAIISNDGGVKARKACDFGIKIHNAEILNIIATNSNPDVRFYCLDSLTTADYSLSTSIVTNILKTDYIWIKQRKIGELICGQIVYNEKMCNLLAKLFNKPGFNIDLFDKINRDKLIDDLSNNETPK